MQTSDEIRAAARAVSDAVNHMWRGEAEAFAEELYNDHRTLIQLKTDVFIRFLRLVAAGGFDARNEAAVERARIMVKALDEAGFDYPRGVTGRD